MSRMHALQDWCRVRRRGTLRGAEQSGSRQSQRETADLQEITPRVTNGKGTEIRSAVTPYLKRNRREIRRAAGR